MRQATDCTQVTVTKKLERGHVRARLDRPRGTVPILNERVRLEVPATPASERTLWDPTAQHCVELTQVTLLRIPPLVASGTELEASVQPAPSQCSSKSPDAMPLVSVVAPDAQQSEEFTQVTPVEEPHRWGSARWYWESPSTTSLVPVLDQPLIAHRAREDGKKVGNPAERARRSRQPSN